MSQGKIPYGRQTIDEDDIQAVVEVLRGDWLTTGPKVKQFEEDFSRFVEAPHAVAVSNGTAALHAAMHVLEIGQDDEVIVPAITFAATANAVVYCGASPVFADVCPQTLLVDPESVAKRITARTKAIIAVDYAGQPCDYAALRKLADEHGLRLVADACHALGATCHGKRVGSIADVSTFSFHPVKHIATGEGGMVTTADADLDRRLRIFRNHGITTDHSQREAAGAWHYEMVDLGFNYRLSDIQCALGVSQLRKLPAWLQRRREIASRYAQAFGESGDVRPLGIRPEVEHAWHLYVVRTLGPRDQIFADLRGAGLGVNVHYVPVHLHPYYRRTFGTGPGLCPVAEAAYQQILSLPMYPALTDADVDRVVTTVRSCASRSRAA